MNWYAIFYWLTVANNFRALFITLIVIFTATSVVAWGFFLFNRDANSDAIGTLREDSRHAYKWIWWSTPLAIIFWMLYLFTPSKTDTLFIIAGGAVGNFVTSDTNAKAIPSEVMLFVRSRLKEEITSSNTEVKKMLNMQSPREKLLDKAKDLTKEELIEYLKTDTTAVK